MAHAVEIERLELRCVDYISDRNLGRRPCKDVPAAGASGARDDTGAPEPEKYLLDVIGRQALLTRDLPPVHGPEFGPLGEVERANHAVFSPGRYPHAFRIGIKPCSDKGRSTATATERARG